MKAFYFLALCLVAVPASAAQQQFDLVCTSSAGSVDRWRVDLSKGEACSGKCDRVWKMGASSSGELKVIDKQPEYRGDMEESMIVNRQTGEYRYYNHIQGLSPSSRSGSCALAPFSGFPVTKF